MPILPSLRINPVATINSSNIFVLPQGYAFPAGPVTITEISLRRGSLFRLIPTPLGTDFYFPFIPNNVGSCVVNHPFNGQIVTTLALSGCAIEVHSFPSLNRYVFYHDSDGRNMYRIPPTNRGAQVCRIQSGSYWDNYGLYKTAAPNVQFIFAYEILSKWQRNSLIRHKVPVRNPSKSNWREISSKASASKADVTGIPRE